MNDKNDARELDGPAGADVSGGEVTSHKSAGAAMEQVLGERTQETQTAQQQLNGQVAAQTTELKPTSANPAHGMPNSDGHSGNAGAAGVNE